MNKTVDDHSAERERVEVGAGGCGCPITRLVDVVNGELRGHVEDTDRTEHDGGCWDDRRVTDVDEARIAALAEYMQRTLDADDGPGRDQHGPHERRIVDWSAYGPCPIRSCYAATGNPCQFLGAVGLAEQRDAPHAARLLWAADEGVAEMNGPAVSVEHDAARQGDADLETRVRNTIYDREQGIVSRRLAARQIIRVVRDFDQRASHEGATISDADGGCE